MAGILSYGAYIPMYRLRREELAKVWGDARDGERSVANSDEDSITMAVEAVIDCLNGIDRQSVDGLYLASISSPYRVKKASSIIAAAADLRQNMFTADFTNSFGAGASALRAALDAVEAGTANKVLVVASDCVLAPPNSASEAMFGDGAVALLIGKTDMAATIDRRYSISSDLMDVWRRDRRDNYIRRWEDRFVIDSGYTAYTKDVIAKLLEECNLKVNDVTKFAYYAPDPRSHAGIGRALELGKNQIQAPMFDVLGNTCTALFMMILAAALEKAKPGDRIVTASYGDGADAFLLQTTERIRDVQNRRGIERHLASKMMLANYGTYLRFRDLMEWEQIPRPEVESAVTVMWRDESVVVRGHGSKCRACGHVQYPSGRICVWCQAKDQFEEVRFSDKQGKIFSYSLDNRALLALDLPNVLVVVDMDVGSRVYGQLTDRDPNKLELGMTVEMTFRKFHEGAGFHNYAWKYRPVRC